MGGAAATYTGAAATYTGAAATYWLVKSKNIATSSAILKDKSFLWAECGNIWIRYTLHSSFPTLSNAFLSGPYHISDSSTEVML